MRVPLFLFLLVHVSLQVVPSLASFNWTNCGSTTDVIHIKSLSIDLDPIQVPGKLHINAEVSVEKELTAPIWVKLKVSRKVGTQWKKIFSDRVDVCALSPFSATDCPQEFQEQKIPCKCPVALGTYTLDKFVLPIIDPELPEWMIKGSYRVRVKFSTEGGEKLGCYKVGGELIAKVGTNEENEPVKVEDKEENKPVKVANKIENEPEKIEEKRGNEKKHKKQNYKKDGKKKKTKKPKHEL